MNPPLLKSKVIGSGKPLVLLHAFPLSSQLWENFEAPAGFRLILPDFPGFGLSPLAESGSLLEDVARGLMRHLEELRVNEPIALGGISMGGYLALEFIRQFPDRVKTLALISTRAGVDKPEARQKRLEVAQRVEKEGSGFLVEAMIPGLLGKTTRETKGEIVDRVTRWIREVSPEAVALAQRAMANRLNQNDLLPTIKVKSIVMAGLEDTLIPPTEAEFMVEAIPGAEIKLITGAGHLIPLETPEIFKKSLDEFLV